jgi:hypothetical protein
VLQRPPVAKSEHDAASKAVPIAAANTAIRRVIG